MVETIIPQRFNTKCPLKEERTESTFDWSMLGDIEEGRPNLGSLMEVSVYRLMQFTLRDVLIKKYGVEAADHVFYDAGEEAGRQLYRNVITKKDSLTEFIGELQEVLKDLKIGVLRVGGGIEIAGISSEPK